MSDESANLQETTHNFESFGDWWDNYYTQVLGIKTFDQVVASVYIVGILVGLLGNGSAICFFWPRRKKTIHDLLYLFITIVDFLTVLSFPAIVVSLINNRHEMLFKNEVFCTGWVLVVTFTTRMSMFLAMTICVTRTFAMKYHNRCIKRSWVVGTIAIYAAYMIVNHLIYFF